MRPVPEAPCVVEDVLLARGEVPGDLAKPLGVLGAARAQAACALRAPLRAGAPPRRRICAGAVLHGGLHALVKLCLDAPDHGQHLGERADR